MSRALARLGVGLLAAAVAGAAVVLLAGIHAGAVRREAIVMVAVVAAAAAWPRRAPGPLAAVLAAELLLFLHALGTAGDATTQIVVWTVMLSLYVSALGGRLAPGVGVGAGAALLWLAAVAVHPALPTSNAPALAVVAVAAVAGERLRDRTAGLRAAATAALLIAVLLDGLLPFFSQWAPNSAPPLPPVGAPQRLVDSVGVWLVGALLAALLAIGHAKVTRRGRRRVTLRA